MTREEVKRVLEVISATYPNFKITDAKKLVDAWYFFLEDESAYEIGMALKTYVKSADSSFAPSVNQLIEITRRTKEKPVLSGEAWAKVRLAIQNSSYHSVEEFNNLPPEIQRAVGSPDVLRSWGQMDSQTVQSVIASNFKRSYEAVMKSKAENDYIRQQESKTKALTDSLAEKLAIGVSNE